MKRTHYNYGNVAFCQIGRSKSKRTKQPILTNDERQITCPKCLEKFGKQDSR